MSTADARSGATSGTAGVKNADMKIEVVVIPVSNVDRAKEFYERLGWRLDVDRAAGDDFRLVQFTPPGSACSIQFGTQSYVGCSRFGPGPAADRHRRHEGTRRVSRARHRYQRRVPLCNGNGLSIPGWRRSVPARRRISARSRQLLLLRILQRPRRQRVGPPRGHDPTPGSCRSRSDVICNNE